MSVTRKCRQTGLPVTVGHGDELGLDTVGEGPWYTICDEHSQFCSHTTHTLAKSWAAAPATWCEMCQETLQEGIES